MPDIHPHDELLELAYPYALDALAEPDRRSVERMLARADDATAAAFRATVRDLHETLADMTIMDAVPVPSNIEEALLRELDERNAPAPHRDRARLMRWLSAAAAIVVAIGLGVGIAVIRSQSHESSDITAQQVITHADTRSETTPVTGGGSMTVSTSRELGAATVTFDAVPPAPTGRTYQMWLIDAAGRPQSAGVLDTLPGSRTPMLLRTGDAGEVAMSIEPTGGSTTPTDPRVKAPLR
ncbi:anti-sigma factor domain-containing protein [Nocardia sp. NPDC051570]|uniref:anti-sigma factor n=1 Tax=Nocardia sp. NPDC051570 TaxID=3364324 RepID=UPI0037A4F5BE